MREGYPHRRRRLLTGSAATLLGAASFVAALAGPAAAATLTSGTTTTLLGTPWSEPYGDTFEVTALVQGSGSPDSIGNPTTGHGTVVFSDTDGYFDCSVAINSSDEASCIGSSFTAVGSDTVTASYGGSSYTNGANSDVFSSSSGNGALTVTTADTSTALASSGATVGQSATLTATISSSAGGPANGTSTVAFSDGDGFVSGCGAVAVVLDQATCTTATLTTAESDSISAAFSGNSEYGTSSDTTTMTINKAGTALGLSTAGGSVGGTATITATVSPTPGGGTVAFSDADGYVSGCSAQLVTGTTATCATSTLTAAGSETVSATYSGDSNYLAAGPASTMLTVAEGSTSLDLAASPSDPSVGGTTTVTATISPAPGGGHVAFSDADGYLSCSSVAVSGTTASCVTSTLTAAGTDAVNATYSGDTNYAGSSGSLSLSTSPGTPTVTVASAPTNPTVGEQATITATISPAPSGGAVAFSDSEGFISGCGAVAVSGTTASCRTSTFTAVEADTVTATYSGDANYYGAGSFFTLHIAPAVTTVTVGASPITPTVSGTTTISATVAPAPDGGTVAFSDSRGYVSGCGGVAVVGGIATCASGTLAAAGTDSITASYSGDTNYGSSSGGLSLPVAKVTTTVTAGATPSTVTAGEDALVTATVSPVPDGGTITFTDTDGAISGCTNVALSSGTATCTTAEYAGSGSDSITATYSGDTNYTTASSTFAVAVNKITTTLAVAFNPQTPVYGQTATITATLAPVPGGGTVAFGDSDGLVVGCGAVPVNTSDGEASCISATLTKSGVDGVTASYSGTTEYAVSSEGSSLVIDQAPVITSSAEATVTVGAASSFSVTAAGYPTPSFSATGSLPSGLSLSSDGALVGTPAPGAGGTYTIGVQATNSLDSATQQLAITVDQPPAFSNGSSVTFPYGTYSSFTVSVAPGTYPVPSISESGALPSGVLYQDDGNGSATLYGTPDDDVGGSFGVTFAADNGVGASSQDFTITISGTPTVTTMPPTTTSPPTTPTTAPTQAASLPTLELAVDSGRAGAVPSAGSQPAISVGGKLPKRFNAAAPLDDASKSVALGPKSSFPVLGNVGAVGDCTVVAIADVAIADHRGGRLSGVPHFTTAGAIREWHVLNGDTANGVTDARLLDAATAKAGILGVRVLGWRALEVSDVRQIKSAIRADGALYAGIVVPEDTGRLGTVWEESMGSTTPVSGHAVALDGWNSRGFLVATFGEVVLIPFSWWESHAESVYALSIEHEAHAPSEKP